MQHLLQSFFADGLMPPGLLPHVTAALRSPARPGTALMDLDFVETPDKYRVVCDMPGVKADDIDVFVDDDHVLHIVGHKKAVMGTRHDTTQR
jgi:HSP20 family molecular chaperone IbpA